MRSEVEKFITVSLLSASTKPQNDYNFNLQMKLFRLPMHDATSYLNTPLFCLLLFLMTLFRL